MADFALADRIAEAVAGGETLDIYVSYHDVSNEFAPFIRDGVARAGEELGVNAVFIGPVGADADAQISEIETLMGQMDGLAISSVSTDALAPLINRVIEAGIPVVTYNTDNPESDRLVFAGQDLVQSGRGMGVVQMLADEDIPVVGHVGMVPRKSTWMGGVRAVGKTAAEALDLHRRFRRLEEAGAFAVEAELIVEPVMAELTARTGLVTISLGSGRHADVIFQFMSDVCGEEERSPRHARTYGRIATLRQQIRDERVRALTAFCRDVERRDYPGQAETVAGSQEELDRFKQLLDRETA